MRRASQAIRRGAAARCTLSAVISKRTDRDRQIDQALLATATVAGFVYVRRRIRRLVQEAMIGAAIAAGLGALGAAGVVAAWRRNRTSNSA
jgi:hypothetical protein